MGYSVVKSILSIHPSSKSILSPSYFTAKQLKKTHTKGQQIKQITIPQHNVYRGRANPWITTDCWGGEVELKPGLQKEKIG